MKNFALTRPNKHYATTWQFCLNRKNQASITVSERFTLYLKTEDEKVMKP